MLSHNSPAPRRRYSDMVVGQRPHKPTVSNKVYIDASNEQAIAQAFQKQQLIRRIRRLARVAVVATRTGATSRQRRLLAYKRKTLASLRTIQQNQYRLVAGTFVVVFALSAIIPPFLQADTSKSIALSNEVKALVGESRDDAKEYLKFDDKQAAYKFEVPQDNEQGKERTGRNVDAYTTDLAVNA